MLRWYALAVVSGLIVLVLAVGYMRSSQTCEYYYGERYFPAQGTEPGKVDRIVCSRSYW